MVAQFEIDPLLIRPATTETETHQSPTPNRGEPQLLFGEELIGETSLRPDTQVPRVSLEIAALNQRDHQERQTPLDQLPERVKTALRYQTPLEREEGQDFYSIQVMAKIFGVSEATLYGWSRRGIIAKKSVPTNPQSAWLISDQDGLIIHLILQRNIQSSFKAKTALAEAIRSGRSPREALEVSRKMKKLNIQIIRKAKEELLRFRENLQRAIDKEELQEPHEPLSLYRLVKWIRTVLPKAPCAFTLDRFVKITNVLGETTSLPPGEAMVNNQGEWRYTLTLKGLIAALQIAHDVLTPENLSVNMAYQQALDKLEDKRGKRVTVDEMVLPVLNAQGVSTPSLFRQERTKSLLLGILREKEEGKRLPLPPDLPLREALLYGIPLEQTEAIAGDWAGFIEEWQRKPEKEPSISEMLDKWSSLSKAMRTNLPPEVKVDPRTVPYAAAWMKAEGIQVKTITRKQDERTVFYYRLRPSEKMSPEQREIWETVFTDTEKMATLTRILEQGLSLEEILALKEHFPDNFSFSITHAYWLATGERGCLGSAKKASVLKALEKNEEVTVVKKTTSTGKTLHHVPFDQLEKAVAVLKSL